MKEVLIYGALIAAVMGISTTLIGNLRGSVLSQTQTIDNAITTNISALIQAGSGGGGTN